MRRRYFFKEEKVPSSISVKRFSQISRHEWRVVTPALNIQAQMPQAIESILEM